MELATTTPNNPQAIAIYQRMNDPLDAITKMGQMFASSGMFGCTKLEQGQVLALACLVQGKDPFELMQNYYIINGSLSMKSVAVLANFMRAGGRVKWYSALNDVVQAEADFEIGENKLDHAIYTIENAETEGLIAGPNKNNWKVRPADMLRARLITKAVRMIAPGIIMGMQEETDANNSPVPDRPLLRKELEPELEPPQAELPQTLEEAILNDGSISVKEAVDWLVNQKILEEGQGLTDLTPSYTRKVMKNFGRFAIKVREFVVAKETPADATAS